MTNGDLSETIRDNIKLVFNILAQSHIIKHIQKLSRNIQVHSVDSVNPVYSEPSHIRTYSIFTILKYSQHLYVENPGIVRTLVYTEPWHIQKRSHILNHAIFRLRTIFLALSGISNRALYKSNANSFLHFFSNMSNCNLRETTDIKLKLILNILAFSDILRSIHEPCLEIQRDSVAWVNPVYLKF